MYNIGHTSFLNAKNLLGWGHPLPFISPVTIITKSSFSFLISYLQYTCKQVKILDSKIKSLWYFYHNISNIRLHENMTDNNRVVNWFSYVIWTECQRLTSIYLYT